MKITTKGQVTIPQEIREKAGLLPHTEVEFEYVRGRVTLTPVPVSKGAGRGIVESLRGSAGATRKGMTTDALMKLLRN